MIDTQKIAKEIMGIEIEHNNGELSDNLAVMLASFFEESIHHPADLTLDQYECWTKWSSDQVDLIESKIKELLDQHFSQINSSKSKIKT
jgi:hypothetical protein